MANSNMVGIGYHRSQVIQFMVVEGGRAGKESMVMEEYLGSRDKGGQEAERVDSTGASYIAQIWKIFLK